MNGQYRSEAYGRARTQLRRHAALLERLALGNGAPLGKLEGWRVHLELADLVIRPGLIEGAIDTGATYAEIGRALGVSRQAVRQDVERRWQAAIEDEDARLLREWHARHGRVS